METTKLFGKMNSETVAEENETCRRIVKEVQNFGVTQRQQLMLIYLLALELEDVAKMKAITTLVRDLGEDMFLSGKPEE